MNGSLCGFVGAGLGGGGDEHPEVVAHGLVLEDVLDHGLPGHQVVALPDEVNNRIHLLDFRIHLLVMRIHIFDFRNLVEVSILGRMFGLSTCFLDGYLQTGSVDFRTDAGISLSYWSAA